MSKAAHPAVPNPATIINVRAEDEKPSSTAAHSTSAADPSSTSGHAIARHEAVTRAPDSSRAVMNDQYS